VSMPPAVEVLLAGVRMLYPTCYVLVTDLDASAQYGDSQTSNIAKAAHASRDTGSFQLQDFVNAENRVLIVNFIAAKNERMLL
jgi:hypothetical protein